VLGSGALVRAYALVAKVEAAYGASMWIVSLLFGFGGRVGRRQFWIAEVIVNLPICFCYGVLSVAGGLQSVDASPLVLGIALSLFTVQVWINSALLVKRLHDRNRSAWNLLTLGFPLPGRLRLLRELFATGAAQGSNRFGPDQTGEILEPVEVQQIKPTRYAGHGEGISI
jgi:uncharacterized membrane protein YhaH (DUF805 family)